MTLVVVFPHIMISFLPFRFAWMEGYLHAWWAPLSLIPCLFFDLEVVEFLSLFLGQLQIPVPLLRILILMHFQGLLLHRHHCNIYALANQHTCLVHLVHTADVMQPIQECNRSKVKDIRSIHLETNSLLRLPFYVGLFGSRLSFLERLRRC